MLAGAMAQHANQDKATTWHSNQDKAGDTYVEDKED